MQNIATVFVLTSQYTEETDFCILSYSYDRNEVIEQMEAVALTELKKQLNKKDGEDVVSPLRDTIPVEQIISGITIRYRCPDLKDVIDVIKIERKETGYILSSKKRMQSIIKTFRIIKVNPVSSTRFNGSIDSISFNQNTTALDVV